MSRRTRRRYRQMAGSPGAYQCGWGSLTTVGIILAGCGLAAAQPRYEGFHVEAFNPGYNLREVYFWDVNEMQEACGTSTDASTYSAFIWTPQGDKTRTGPMTWPYGLNNVGHVVGLEYIRTHATNETRTVTSPDPAYPRVRLQDINDREVAIGYTEVNRSNSDRMLQIPIAWSPQRGSWTVNIANAKEFLRVNNANVAVGNIRISPGQSQGFVYNLDTNAYVNLSDRLGGWSTVSNISESGIVTGKAAAGGFIWTEADGFTFLPGLGGGPAAAINPTGVNDARQVVGYAWNGQFRAFVWSAADGMHNLNDLVERLPDQYVMWRAMALSENGWIVGEGRSPAVGGFATGFVLKPIGGFFSLSASGTCPGPMTLTATGATPRGRVAFIAAQGRGSVVIPPGNPCSGTQLGLNQTAYLLADVTADANGSANVSGNAPPNACGRVFLQALDVSTCKTSNVEGI